MHTDTGGVDDRMDVCDFSLQGYNSVSKVFSKPEMVIKSMAENPAEILKQWQTYQIFVCEN